MKIKQILIPLIYVILLIALQIIFLSALSDNDDFAEVILYKKLIFFTDLLVLMSILYYFLKNKSKVIRLGLKLIILVILISMFYSLRELYWGIVFIILVGVILNLISLYKELKNEKSGHC